MFEKFLMCLSPETIIAILRDLDAPWNQGSDYLAAKSEEREKLCDQYKTLTGLEWPNIA